MAEVTMSHIAPKSIIYANKIRCFNKGVMDMYE